MDVRIDQAPGQAPRRRQAAAQPAPASPRANPGVAISYAPPPVLIRIPDLEAEVPAAPILPEPKLGEPRTAEVRTRVDSPIPFPTQSLPTGEEAAQEQAAASTISDSAPLASLANSAHDSRAFASDAGPDGESSPAPYMPKLPPVLQRAGSYRASPTVLLGVIVVVLCLAALPLLRSESDSKHDSDGAQRTAEREPAPWPGVPNAQLAEAESKAAQQPSEALAAAPDFKTQQQPATSSKNTGEAPAATVAQLPIAQSNSAGAADEPAVSRWPRETSSTPVAQFEGSIVRPTLRAQNERVGSSIH